jgi:hypothetical protein
MSNPQKVRHISECFVKPEHAVEEAKRPFYLITWDLAMLYAHYIQKGLLFTKPPAADEQEGFIYTLAFVGRCFVHRDGVIVCDILLNRDGPRHLGLHLGDLLVAQGVSIGVLAREFYELGPCNARREGLLEEGDKRKKKGYNRYFLHKKPRAGHVCTAPSKVNNGNERRG